MKLNLAVFKLTSCSGCLNQLVTTLLSNDDVRETYRVVYLEELGVLRGEAYDVAFVEGSVSSRDQLWKLMEVRSRTRILVALGTCALEGGVQTLYDTLNGVDGPKPLHELVTVDHAIPGCPVSEDQLLRFLRKLALGGRPLALFENVCCECKRRGVECLVITRRDFCLGPVTVGGCNALCPANGRGCYGCSGLRIHDLDPDKLGRLMLRLALTGGDEGVVKALLRAYGSSSLRRVEKGFHR